MALLSIQRERERAEKKRKNTLNDDADEEISSDEEISNSLR